MSTPTESTGPIAWLHRLDQIARLPIAPVLYVAWKYREGMGSVVRAHDQLEHFVPVYDRMSLSEVFAPPGQTLDYVLGGLPRDTAGSELFLGLLLGSVLPVLWSLLVTDLVARLVAYYGMRRLLRMLGLSSERVVYLAVPIAFSLIPLLPAVVASVAGVPLLLSALINLARAPTARDYLVLATFPMISWAGATIPYVAIAVVGIVMRRASPAVWKGVGLLAAATAVVEWRLVKTTVFGPVSHRVEMGTVDVEFDLAALSGSAFRLGRSVLELFEKHAVDAATVLTPLSFVVLGAAAIAVLVRRSQPTTAGRVLLVLGAAIASIGVVSRLWPYVDRFVATPPIQFDRLAWAVPGLVYAGLAAALVVLVRALPEGIGVVMVLAVLGVQAGAAWQAADFADSERAQVSLEEFYASEVFSEAMALVDEEELGRVVSVGFHPHVAVYNGFDAADGYWYSYPLEYKERFRDLIAPALDVDAGLAFYFDDWGSRAYVFQPELGLPPCCRPPTPAGFELVVDPTAFGSLGVTHVLSNGIISNDGDMGLVLLGTVGAPTSYEISVYATSS